MYLADTDPKRGENVCVSIPINYLGNIRNIVNGHSEFYCEISKGI